MKYFVTIEFQERRIGWIVYPFKNMDSAVNFVNVKFPEYQNYKYDIDALPKHWIKDFYYYEFSVDDYLIRDSLNYKILEGSTDGELSMHVIKSYLPFNPKHFVIERSQEAIFMIERN